MLNQATSELAGGDELDRGGAVWPATLIVSSTAVAKRPIAWCRIDPLSRAQELPASSRRVGIKNCAHHACFGIVLLRLMSSCSVNM